MRGVGKEAKGCREGKGGGSKKRTKRRGCGG